MEDRTGSPGRKRITIAVPADDDGDAEASFSGKPLQAERGAAPADTPTMHDGPSSPSASAPYALSDGPGVTHLPLRREGSPQRSRMGNVSICATAVTYYAEPRSGSNVALEGGSSQSFLEPLRMPERGERVAEAPSTSAPAKRLPLRMGSGSSRAHGGSAPPKARKGPSNFSRFPDIRRNRSDPHGAAGLGPGPQQPAVQQLPTSPSGASRPSQRPTMALPHGAAMPLSPNAFPYSPGAYSPGPYSARSPGPGGANGSPSRGAPAAPWECGDEPWSPGAATLPWLPELGLGPTPSSPGPMPALSPGAASGYSMISAGVPEFDDALNLEGDVLANNDRLRSRIKSLPNMVCRSANGDVYIVDLGGVQAILQKRNIGVDGLQVLGRVSPQLYGENATVRERRRNAKRAVLGHGPADGPDDGGGGDDAAAAAGGAAAQAQAGLALPAVLDATPLNPVAEEEVRRHLEHTTAHVEAHRRQLEEGWRVARGASPSVLAAEREAEMARQRDAAVEYAVETFLPSKLVEMACKIHVPKAARDKEEGEEEGLLEHMRRELAGGEGGAHGAEAGGGGRGWAKMQTGINRLYEKVSVVAGWAAATKELSKERAAGWDELLTGGGNGIYVKGHGQHQGTNIYVLKCQELGVTPCTQVVQQLNVAEANMSHCKLGRQGAAALRHALAANSTITHLDLLDNSLDATAVHDLIAGLYSGTFAKQPHARKGLEQRWRSLEFMHHQPAAHKDLVVNLIPQSLQKEQNLRRERELEEARNSIAASKAAAAAARRAAQSESGAAAAPDEEEAAGQGSAPAADGAAQEEDTAAADTAGVGTCSTPSSPGHGARFGRSAAGLPPMRAVPGARSIFCSVVSMDLSENPLGINGVRSIADMLDPAVTPTQFMRRLALNKCGIPEAGGRALALALSHGNTTLEVLRLSNNGLSNKTAAVLGELFTTGVSGIRDLDLSWNHIKADGAKSLASGLAGNDVLVHLDLSWNGLENEGVMALGGMLPTNKALRYLDLTNTRMGSEAALMLSEGIKSNMMLEVLILNGNSVGDDGARYLMNALKLNTSLQYLGLQGTNMTAAARGHSGSSGFNPLSPDGTYNLNLASAPDKAVAMTLAQLDAASVANGGGDLMRNIKLNDRNVSSAKAMNWPAAMPTSGMLQCDFVSKRVRKAIPVMEAKKFQALASQLSDNAMGDKEKLNLCEVLAPFNYLHCSQAATLLRAFTIGDEMVLAAALLFARCTDLDDNVMVLTEVLPDSSHDKLQATLGWYSYTRFSNATGHYEFSLSNKVHHGLASRLKDVAYSEPTEALNWVNVIYEQYTTALKVPNNFGPPENWKGLVPPNGSLSLDYVSAVLAPEDAQPVSDTLLHEVLSQDLGIGMDPAGCPVPEPDYAQACEQVARLRPIVANMCFTAAQVKRLVESFEASPHRVEVFVTCCCLIVDRKQIWQVLYALRPLEQAMAMWRLGPANLFDKAHPTAHYVLDLSNPAHEQITKKLVDIANANPELPNFWNIRLNGQRRAITENRNMWGTLTAETFTPFLEFDFIGPDGFEAMGRTKAEVDVLGAGERLEQRTKQARRNELLRLKTMYSYYDDGSGWQRPAWQSRSLLMRALMDKAPWQAAWDRLTRTLLRYELRSGDVEGDSPLEDMFFNATAGEDVMTAEQLEALLKDWGYNKHEVAFFREAMEKEGREATPADGAAYKPPPPPEAAPPPPPSQADAATGASQPTVPASATGAEAQRRRSTSRFADTAERADARTQGQARESSASGGSAAPASLDDQAGEAQGASASDSAAASAAPSAAVSRNISMAAASSSAASSVALATLASSAPSASEVSRMMALPRANTVVEFMGFVNLIMKEPPRALRLMQVALAVQSMVAGLNKVVTKKGSGKK